MASKWDWTVITLRPFGLIEPLSIPCICKCDLTLAGNGSVNADYYHHHVTQVLTKFKQPSSFSIFSPAQHNDTHQLILSDPIMLVILYLGVLKFLRQYFSSDIPNTGNLHVHEGALSTCTPTTIFEITPLPYKLNLDLIFLKPLSQNTLLHGEAPIRPN